MNDKKIPGPQEGPIELERTDMNTNQPESSAPSSPETVAADSYAVGRGKPPRAHQFKPGQSGNPKGRKKGSKNESTILRELMAQKIKIRIRGKERIVTALEGLHTRFLEDAFKGNVKSAQFLLNRFGAMVSGQLGESSISDNDSELLEEFRQAVLKGNTKKEDSDE